jgi:hypothetical protein
VGCSAADQAGLGLKVSRETSVQSQQFACFAVGFFRAYQLKLKIAWLDWLEELFCSDDVTHEISQIKVKITRISVIKKDPMPGSSEFFIHVFPLLENEQQDYSCRQGAKETTPHDE